MLAKKSRHFAIGRLFADRFKTGYTIMELLIYIYFLLPVLLAFIVLWYIDSALIQKVDAPVIVALIEVFVAMLIIAVAERIVFYFLFGQ